MPLRLARSDAAIATGLAVIVVLGALLTAGLLPGVAPAADRSAQPTPTAAVVVGEPGGEVVNLATPTPTPEPSREPDPTAAGESPDVTAEETPAPVAAATPVPEPVSTPAPTLASTPPPAVAVASVGPADTVAAFYRRVTAGQFDAAYALWSDRMKSTYPRTANLDERFDDTAAITFNQLAVVEQTATSATVQANFTETYDGGSSREFVGFWRLVPDGGGGWLLDEPHY